MHLPQQHIDVVASPSDGKYLLLTVLWEFPNGPFTYFSARLTKVLQLEGPWVPLTALNALT